MRYMTAQQIRRVAVISAAAAFIVGGQLHAGIYNWNSTAGGTWTDTSASGWNTDPAPAYPSLAGDSASLAQPLTATATVTLNVPVTLGSLSLAGATKSNGGGSTTDQSWRLSGTAANSLTFDTLSGNATLSANGGNPSIGAPVQLNKPLDVTVTGTTSDGWGATPPASVAFAGAVSGTGSITKAGTGSLTFGATNTFVGDISISVGRIGARKTGSLGNAANVVTIASGAGLDVGPGANGGMTISNPITMTGANALRYTQWGGATLAGRITLSGDSSIVHTSGASNEFYLTGGIDLGNRTLTLQGGNYASGNIYINNTGLLGTAGAVVLTHGGTSGTTRLNLNAPSNYTGSTTIQHAAATLWLNSSITSNVLVNAGQLRGNGTVAAANTTTIGNGTGTADAIFGPGAAANTIGLFSTGDLALNSDSRYAIEINSTTLAADLVQAYGDVSISPSAQLAVADLGSTALTAGSLTILRTFDGGQITGTFQNLPDGADLMVGSNTYTVEYLTDRVVLSVPEPGALLGVLTLAGVAGTRRRRVR